MLDKIEGKAHIFADNIDTDVIIPARYLNTSNPRELAAHCMEDIDSKFVERVQEGEIIVAGENFGCGSSREHAVIAIKSAGISCVLAKSFARIFFRNAFNLGLPIFELPSAARIEVGQRLEIDVVEGKLKVQGEQPGHYDIIPIPPFMRQLLQAGGLMSYLRQLK